MKKTANNHRLQAIVARCKKRPLFVNSFIETDDLVELEKMTGMKAKVDWEKTS